MSIVPRGALILDMGVQCDTGFQPVLAMQGVGARTVPQRPTSLARAGCPCHVQGAFYGEGSRIGTLVPDPRSFAALRMTNRSGGHSRRRPAAYSPSFFSSAFSSGVYSSTW